MLDIFKKKKVEKKTNIGNITKSSLELLSETKRTELINKIKRGQSVTEAIWEKHYLYAISKFAELVQEVPASEIHHHSNKGGLIDHTLEAVYNGARIAQGYILPPNSEPEKIAQSADKWRFGVFITILAHDLGKIVTDIEVVYRSSEDSTFKAWHPWSGILPAGLEYKYRFRDRTKNSKTLHEKASMSLLPVLLTREATNWIFSDSELLSQIFSTITHSSFGGDVIAEIVRAADGASVGKNLGANTGTNIQYSNQVPLHEKIIVSLRKLVNDNELKRNKPGAQIWVTNDHAWVVSKASMDAVKAQLQNEGHKGIPNNVVRFFSTLNEHKLIVPNPEGESIWTAEINDFARNWQHKLTFLKFKKEVIWPTSKPDEFDGEVIPINKKGEVINIENNSKNDTSAEVDNKSKTEKPALEESLANDNNTQPKANSTDVLKKENTEENSQEPKQSIVSSSQAKKAWLNSKKVKESALLENEFLHWLINGISRRKIRVNEAKAPVHILDAHIALVTPSIFNMYLKNSLKKRLYEKRAGDKKVYTLIQKELESLEIHQRGMNGQNIVTLSVEGQRSQSELKVYLLNRDCFSSLANFHSNKAMKIKL